MVVVGLRRAALPFLLILHAIAFVALLWAHRRNKVHLNHIGLILGWALLFRLTLLPALPDLSDDYYRYIWDGNLVAKGVSPYAHAPADPELADRGFVDNALLGKLNSKDFHSVYPPLSQLVFLCGGWFYEVSELAPSFLMMKSLFVLMEFTGLCFLITALRRTSTSVSAMILYAWNPLVIIEIAGQGHTEGAMVLGMGLAAHAACSGRAAISWLGLTLAAMTKLLPFAFVPLWLRYFRGRGLWLGLTVAIALCVPFWTPSLIGTYESVQLYVQYFEFNAGLYFTIKQILYWFTGDDWSKQIGPLLRWVFAAIAIGIYLFHRVDGPQRLLQASLLLFSAYLITATTVHPWYVTWVLPLIPFTPMLRWPWFWFSFACFASYVAYTDIGQSRLLWGLLVYPGWIGFYVLAAINVMPWVLDRLMRRRGRSKARQLLAHVRGRRVLDLGCAEGFVADALSKNGCDCILADVIKANKTSLPFVLYDGDRIPFNDDQFDTVVLSLVLHHCRNPLRVLREAARVSRHRVVITESTFETGRDRARLEFLDRHANRLRSRGLMQAQEEYLDFKTPTEWRDLFVQAGLRLGATHWLNRFIHKHVLFVLDVGQSH